MPALLSSLTDAWPGRRHLAIAAFRKRVTSGIMHGGEGSAVLR